MRFHNELLRMSLCRGEEKKGADGRMERKEPKRRERGDYRRHCSLCEGLSLARQGGGTL